MLRPNQGLTFSNTDPDPNKTPGSIFSSYLDLVANAFFSGRSDLESGSPIDRNLLSLRGEKFNFANKYSLECNICKEKSTDIFILQIKPRSKDI